MDRQTIIDEIKRIAAENQGRPPGLEKFQRGSGIASPQWLGVYWENWSEALLEAGFQPNAHAVAFDKNDLLKSLARAVRDLKKYPSGVELMSYARDKQDFPHAAAFQRHFANRAERIMALKNYCEQQDSEFADILPILPNIHGLKSDAQTGASNSINDHHFGYVYLLKFGQDDYKIGASNDPERRFGEIITMPEPPLQIHTIKTDDPLGVEAYWHRRFASKQIGKNSERFQLSPPDVRAFCRWSRIF